MVWTRKFTVLFVLGVAVLLLAVGGSIALLGAVACSGGRENSNACLQWRQAGADMATTGETIERIQNRRVTVP